MKKISSVFKSKSVLGLGIFILSIFSSMGAERAVACNPIFLDSTKSKKTCEEQNTSMREILETLAPETPELDAANTQLIVVDNTYVSMLLMLDADYNDTPLSYLDKVVCQDEIHANQIQSTFINLKQSVLDPQRLEEENTQPDGVGLIGAFEGKATRGLCRVPPSCSGKIFSGLRSY